MTRSMPLRSLLFVLLAASGCAATDRAFRSAIR